MACDCSTELGRVATALERIATSLEFFKDNGVVTKGPSEELNTHSLAKSILGQGTSLTDAVKSGKAIQDAVKDLVANPNDLTKKVPNPPKTLLVKGVWNSSQRYAKDEMVSYKDKIWSCLRDNTNVVPTDDPSYWIQPSCDDITNMQTAPALIKVANDIHSSSPEEGEVVCDNSGKKSIGKKGGGKTPFTDSAIRETESLPTAKNVGQWSGKKQYTKNDVVTYNNKIWVAEDSPPNGIIPSESSGWYSTEKIDEIPLGTPPIDLPDPPTPPTPTYTVIPSSTSINEGSSLTFTVGGTNIVDGTYYWTVTNSGDFATSSGSFTITSNSGSFSVIPRADLTTEGAETFTASIRLGSITGPILQTSSSVTINDTSISPPPPPHTVWSADIHYSKDDVVLFCDVLYKAKVNTFRTIPDRSNDWGEI